MADFPVRLRHHDAAQHREELARAINMADYALETAKGNVTGTTGVNKFGRATAITTTNEWEVWDGNAAYVYPATALMTKISQTTDQSAMRGETIEIQGLAAGYIATTQNAILDGTLTTNAVTLTTPLLRCFRMKVLSDNVTTSPIRVHNTAEDQDYAIISTGYNQTQMAIYTVPASKKAYMTCYYAHHNPKQGQNFTSNPIQVWARDKANSYEAQLKHSVGVAADGGFQHIFNPYIQFGEKTDIFITSTPNGSTADMTAGFDLYLVDD
jgi:hypothetical protein